MTESDSNMTSGRLLMKHTMSCARDAQVTYVLDGAEKVVTLTVATHGGRPFIAASLLENFLGYILPRHSGIQAYDDDNASGWAPARTDWRVILDAGEQRFLVRLIKQIALGDLDRWALELDVVEESES